MYTLIKTYKCFGNLSIENGNLCPDKTIYVDSFKNGKSKVTIFDGAVTNPALLRNSAMLRVLISLSNKLQTIILL